jgi:hypothetical protein
MTAILSLVAALCLSVAPLQSWAEQTPTQAPAPAAAAAPAEKKLSTSQQRMVDCNKEAAGKKGDARRDFMRECMHGDKAGAGSQQNRMKECNKRAGDKKGDARRAFMSECLKNK